MVSLLCLVCGSTLNCQDGSPGARLPYSIVLDEGAKKPKTHTLSMQKSYQKDITTFLGALGYLLVIKTKKGSLAFASS